MLIDFSIQTHGASVIQRYERDISTYALPFLTKPPNNFFALLAGMAADSVLYKTISTRHSINVSKRV